MAPFEVESLGAIAYGYRTGSCNVYVCIRVCLSESLYPVGSSHQILLVLWSLEASARANYLPCGFLRRPVLATGT